eukprot:2053873-Amphidinium_carterae.1
MNAFVSLLFRQAPLGLPSMVLWSCVQPQQYEAVWHFQHRPIPLLPHGGRSRRRAVPYISKKGLLWKEQACE